MAWRAAGLEGICSPFIETMIGFRLLGIGSPTHDSRMDPRYPVGKFVFDENVTPEKRRACVAQLEALPRDLRYVLAQLPPGGLDTPYRENGWTARQVVHHLADSHMNAYMRIKLALTEEAPAIKTYEEQLWAELPDGKSADPALSLGILDGVHQRLNILLQGLAPGQFTRTATHPQWGLMTVDFLVQLYAWHCRHHVAHVGLSAEAARTIAR
jgi:hypothetical protein